MDLGFGSGDNESGFALLSSSKAAVYSVTAAVGVCVYEVGLDLGRSDYPIGPQE